MADTPEGFKTPEVSLTLYKELKEAFLTQLRENRRRLTLKIDEAVDAAVAIHDPNHKLASGLTLAEVLEGLPPFEPAEVFSPLNDEEKSQLETLRGSTFELDVTFFNELRTKSQSGRAVASMFYSSQCRNSVRKANVDIYRGYRDLAVGIGITVATAGLGSYAVALKHGVEIGKFAANASLATQALQRAQLISRALIGFDLAYASVDIVNVTKRCERYINRELTDFFALPVSSSTPYCSNSQNPITGQASTKAIMATAVSNYRACVIDAVFTVGTSSLSFTPEIYRFFRSLKK
jgi:hypothetical protein